MRVTRKVFSIYSEDELISSIEERAFNEGYQAAQKEFGENLDAGSLAREYEDEQKKRKNKRVGGHVMGALGTAGMLVHGAGEVSSRAVERGLAAMPEPQDAVDKKVLKKFKSAKWINRGLGLGAAGLTAGGIYRINKEKNRKQSFDEWLKERNQRED